jgi:hypothetical protein
MKNYKNTLINNFDFEIFFNFFINICFEFNKKHFYFLGNNIAHIKGGSSVKYHLMKKSIDNANITNDIDILLIIDDSIQDFFNFIKIQNSELGIYWKLKNENGLYVLYFNKNPVVDITLYKTNDSFKYTIFNNVVKELGLGYNNVHEYVNALINKENLEEITFTSKQFEILNSKKGLDKYLNFINFGIPKRKQLLNNNLLLNSDIVQRYKYEISEEYINKINNKIRRYKMKIELLEL